MTSSNEHSEGPVARAIEEQTAKLPSLMLFYGLRGIDCGLADLKNTPQHEALFVGQWAPTILILGVYNKLVKQHGSGPESRLNRAVSHSGLDSQIEDSAKASVQLWSAELIFFLRFVQSPSPAIQLYT